MKTATIMLGAALLPAVALAQPAEINCTFNDGKRFTSIASEGKVIFRFAGGEWRTGHAEVKGNTVVVIHITSHGYMRVAFTLPDMRGYGVVRTLPDQKIVWESAAICG